MAKRTLSTKAKAITGIIYALAIVMLGAVIYMNVNPDILEKATPSILSEQTTTASASENLPYIASGSDKYASIEPVYSVGEVTLEEQDDSSIIAYVNGEKAEDYTGVAKNDSGWYFVRDGEVDFYYNGIAGNELGNWYIVNGKVDFSYDGEFTVNNVTYTIEQGRATLAE